MTPVLSNSVLLSPEEIANRVAEMGRQISKEYAGSAVTVIGILKGSFIFVADLIRRIDTGIPVEVDFISVGSYGDSVSSSGKVHIKKDIEVSVEGKNVILVEDIVDTGLTLTAVHDLLARRGAGSIRIATLLEKPESRQYTGHLDYVGFQIPSRFVVGYGLDFAQQYRNLPDIRILDAIGGETGMNP